MPTDTPHGRNVFPRMPLMPARPPDPINSPAVVLPVNVTEDATRRP